MPNPIVALVENEMDRFRVFREANPSIFPDQDNLYPIPFFGDLRKAQVLRLALNPAWTEFIKGGRDERHWIPKLDARALTTRLLHYFDLPDPPPHRWFTYRRRALELLSCSYEKNAAHIDLLSYPTKLRNLLSHTQRRTLGRLIETQSRFRLADLLQLATKAKSLLIVDYTFSRSDGETARTFDFISTYPPIAELLRSRFATLRLLH